MKLNEHSASRSGNVIGTPRKTLETNCRLPSPRKPGRRFIGIVIIVIVIAAASIASLSYFAVVRHDRVESLAELVALDSQSMTLPKLLGNLRADVPFYYHWVRRNRRLSQAVLPWTWLRDMQQDWEETEMRRWVAEQELSEMGTNAWPALANLVVLLEHRNLRVRMAAGEVLAKTRADEAPDWSRFESQLHSGTGPADVFHRLLTGWNRAGTRYGVPERRFALIGLAACGSAAALAYPDVVEVMQSDEDPELRSLAVVVVGKVKARRKHSVPLLGEVLRNEEEWPEVSAAAAVALAEASPKDPATRQLLRAALGDPRSKVRLGAANALWRLGASAEEVLPVLTDLLRHGLASTRAGALIVIAEMGPAARASRAEVQRLTLDESASVRRTAAAALTSMSPPGVK